MPSTTDIANAYALVYRASLQCWPWERVAWLGEIP